VQHRQQTDAEGAALAALLAATVALLDRLRATSDPAERARLGADFEARVADLREDLERRTGLDQIAVEAAVARALGRVAELVRATPPRP